MFKESKDGQTHYCHACETQGRGIGFEGGKHTCGKKDWHDMHPLNTLTGETKREFIVLMEYVEDNALRNVGLLRQWLNEKDRDRLVTNEDIIHWLKLK